MDHLGVPMQTPAGFAEKGGSIRRLQALPGSTVFASGGGSLVRFSCIMTPLPMEAGGFFTGDTSYRRMRRRATLQSNIDGTIALVKVAGWMDYGLTWKRDGVSASSPT